MSDEEIRESADSEEAANQDKEKSLERKHFLKGFGVGIVIAASVLTIIFSLIIYFYSDKYSSIIRNLSLKQINGKLLDVNTYRKSEALYSLLNQAFLFTENIDEEKLRDGALKGIIESLDDPYTQYYNVKEMTEMMEDHVGSYCGVGASVSIDEDVGLPYFVSVYRKSPANKAGARDGDYIYKVEDKEVAGMLLDDVVALVRGEKGTDVNLTIIRDGELIEMTMTRDDIIEENVDYEMKDNSIGYIYIQEFTDNTPAQFNEAMDDLESQNMKALILDLRSNPGGSVGGLEGVGNRILPKGVIVSFEYVDGTSNAIYSEGNTPLDIPLVVLINGYSASASEALTGAIRDYKIGTTIGTKTFGKGIAQAFYEFPDGTGIKYTDSRYMTPSGDCIHGIGIEPDIKLEFDSQTYYEGDGSDNQLDYALEYLTDQLG